MTPSPQSSTASEQATASRCTGCKHFDKSLNEFPCVSCSRGWDYSIVDYYDSSHAPATHAGADTRPGADALVTQPAPGHFDEIALLQKRETERLLLALIQDVCSASSEDEAMAIASENAGIRRELRRLSGRRVSE